jgi:hypothetical protein
MLLECVLIDAFVVSSVVSLALCANGANRGESVAFISELIVQCKQRVETRFIPWVCVAAFACLVFVQMWWMHRVSARWLRASADTENFSKDAKKAGKTGNETNETNEANNGGHLFVLFGAVAVLGFCGVVYFDCNGSYVDRMGHRVGVGALALGTFVALHLVWVNLRAAVGNERLRDESLMDEDMADVPCVTWVEFDLAWVAVLSAFIATGLLENNYIASVWCEYVAFVMLFVQMTWLFLVCLEREHGLRVGKVSGTGFSFGKLLAFLLAAYSVEAALVFVAAMLARS